MILLIGLNLKEDVPLLSVKLRNYINKSGIPVGVIGNNVDYGFTYTHIGLDNKSLAKYIKNNLIFDQLILEFYNQDDPSSGWVHCSYSKEENRKEALLYNGKEYTQWSI